ncbi:hypothetical protein [Arthrobacter sp. 31Y]|uniref:hypothetical protein n=1 Tax=Arthrobacter sp. 31Y TaxID=1115632 RepID=UPI0004650E6D|nr:hypothetical protein [Arthrobacter sp. 31Y]
MSDIASLLQPLKDRLAAATPGPWEFEGTEIVNEPDYASKNPEPFTQVMECDVACGSYCYGGTANLTISPENRSLIQHAPTDQAKLIAAIEAVAELHVPVVIYEVDPVNGTWVYADDERKVLTRLCQACTPASILDDIDEGEYDGGGSDHDVHWPCPTVAALTQALGGDTA